MAVSIDGLSVWEDRAKRLLRIEMARKAVGYKQLCEKMAVMGIQEDETTCGTRCRGENSRPRCCCNALRR